MFRTRSAFLILGLLGLAPRADAQPAPSPQAAQATDETDLAKLYPEPLPRSDEEMAKLKAEADALPPSEVRIANYAELLAHYGQLDEAERYVNRLLALVPENRVAATIGLYIADRRKGGDSEAVLQMRIAQSKRHLAAVYEDLARWQAISGGIPNAQVQQVMAQGGGREAVLAAGLKQIEVNGQALKQRYDLAKDTTKIDRSLVASITSSITTGDIKGALEHASGARARFPTSVELQIYEDRLASMLKAPSVESCKATEAGLKTDLTTLSLLRAQEIQR